MMKYIVLLIVIMLSSCSQTPEEQEEQDVGETASEIEVSNSSGETASEEVTSAEIITEDNREGEIEEDTNEEAEEVSQETAEAEEIEENSREVYSFKTEGGDSIDITPIEHATAVMEWGDEVVYADPVEPTDGFPDPTIIFVSHEHGDHFSNEILSNLDLERVTLITTQTVYDDLAEELQEKATIMNNGDQITKNGFSIIAVPAYNIREEALNFHPKGVGNGYIFEKDGFRVYFSGDSEDTPEMRALEDIDVAFVSMNLPFTMGATPASSAVNEFRPKYVFPYHYRGKEDLTDLEKFKRLVEEENSETEVILAKWY